MEKCINCQNEIKLLGVKEGLNIYLCPNCGLGFTENLKSQKGEYHRDDTYIEEEKLFKNIFLKRVNVISKIMDPGKVLEIGCSTGLMLSLLKVKGWEVDGVEISPKAAQKATERGINVFIQPFEKIYFKGEYDLVVLNHTLEHLNNPVEVIKKVSSVLKQNGLIYIDLPNFNSLSSNIWGSRWPLLLPKEHKWHFTLKSLSILLEKSGFKIIFVERASGIWDYDNPAQGLWNSLVGLKKRFFMELLTAIPSFIATKLSKGSDLMVIAKKI